MDIKAAQVKELRERTGAGMMECKKALVETGGDLEAAVELLRKAGLANADKKASRIAAEGVVAIHTDSSSGAMVEVNSETDFVARENDFRAFANAVARLALERKPDDLDALLALEMPDGQTVEESRRGLISRMGENITVRRYQILSTHGLLGSYVHDSRIGVMVALTGGGPDLAKDLAMHISWSNPEYLTPDDVPADIVDKERRILTEQAEEQGKPPEIVSKMVEGRLRKYLSEITLMGQPFVKDPDINVGKLLKSADAEIKGSVRFQVGEGIEKAETSFAEDVMAQARGG